MKIIVVTQEAEKLMGIKKVCAKIIDAHFLKLIQCLSQAVDLLSLIFFLLRYQCTFQSY